jgi:hypothetical protein
MSSSAPSAIARAALGPAPALSALFHRALCGELCLHVARAGDEQPGAPGDLLCADGSDPGRSEHPAPLFYLVFANTRERAEYQVLPRPSTVESLRAAASNRAFVIAAGVYLLTWIPLDLIQFVLVFLIRDCFRLGPGTRDMIFFVIFLVAAVLLPFWVWVTRRWSKRIAYQTGISFLAVVLTALSFGCWQYSAHPDPGWAGRHRPLCRTRHSAGDPARRDGVGRNLISQGSLWWLVAGEGPRRIPSPHVAGGHGPGRAPG